MAHSRKRRINFKKVQRRSGQLAAVSLVASLITKGRISARFGKLALGATTVSLVPSKRILHQTFRRVKTKKERDLLQRKLLRSTAKLASAGSATASIGSHELGVLAVLTGLAASRRRSHKSNRKRTGIRRRS